MRDVPHSDVAWTELFFKKAFPKPKSKNIHTQLGVHFEEVSEMLASLIIASGDSATTHKLQNAFNIMHDLANHLKQNDDVLVITNHELRVAILDDLCDQIVTATGVGYMLGMNVPMGFGEVNRSNFSKFDQNGNPILDSNLKMVKGDNYFKPNLKPYI